MFRWPQIEWTRIPLTNYMILDFNSLGFALLIYIISSLNSIS